MKQSHYFLFFLFLNLIIQFYIHGTVAPGTTVKYLKVIF
jgi:hypothetical protein